MTTARFERGGFLMIDKGALDLTFVVRQVDRSNTRLGDVEVVQVRGPLDQHDHGEWDCYDAIVERVRAASAGPAKTVVLCMDSPGGDASGVFDAAREIRDICKAAGKPLVAYVDGRAQSAAYALACAAERIIASETSSVGSVGAVKPREDKTAALHAQGVHVDFITSGANKAHGNSAVQMTNEERNSLQAMVEELSELFFNFVHEMRGTDVAHLKSLAAATFLGSGALLNGLIDQVGPMKFALATVASSSVPAREETTMDFAAMKAALAVLAKGDGEDAKCAARMLAALEAPPDGGDKPEDGDKPEGDKPAVKPDTKDDAGAKALALVTDLAAKMQAREVASERATLLASRPDFSPELRAIMADAPIEMVRKAVTTISKSEAKSSVSDSVAALAAVGTRGAGQGDASSVRVVHQLESAKGLSNLVLGVKRERNSLFLGVMPKPAEQAGGAK